MKKLFAEQVQFSSNVQLSNFIPNSPLPSKRAKFFGQTLQTFALCPGPDLQLWEPRGNQNVEALSVTTNLGYIAITYK
jgi:hypothetical protein